MTKDATDFPEGVKKQEFNDGSSDRVTWGLERNRAGNPTAMYMQFSDPKSGNIKGFATLDYGPNADGATYKGITFHVPNQAEGEYFRSTGRKTWDDAVPTQTLNKAPEDVANLASNILKTNKIADPGVTDNGTVRRPPAADPGSIATPPPAIHQ
jgi:hypothetical protein